MELVFVEKAHGPIFDLNPLDQTPLEQAEFVQVKLAKDLFIAGERPREMPAAIIPGVKMEGRLQALPP